MDDIKKAELNAVARKYVGKSNLQSLDDDSQHIYDITLKALGEYILQIGVIHRDQTPVLMGVLAAISCLSHLFPDYTDDEFKYLLLTVVEVQIDDHVKHCPFHRN